MSTEIIIAPSPELQPAALFTPTPKAAQRVLEFFTAQINNDNTRKAYVNATRRFADWCDKRGIGQLADVKPFHVAAFVKELQGELAPPSVKQHLAALRMLLDWLVTAHIIEVNPAHAVRGPKHVVKKGKTPVLNADEARELLDSIEITKTITLSGVRSQVPDITGLRDRALIGVMVYTFARVNAVLQMKVRDYFVQGRRSWVRLHEKGGKEHELPCHHNLEKYIDEYIAAAGVAGDLDGPLFRTTGRKTGQQQEMWQQDAYRMIQRRSAAIDLKTRIGNHTFRATGITAYLKNAGTLEHAQTMANHSSPRTTKLYDRRQDEISLDEVERIAI
ncbi:MAG TPA: tyrosine-type recombinase/integrase [Rhizomicrobium sp.]|nr:tyrosine-type recombinase/integrase [Rhizomicrobium sp.]